MSSTDSNNQSANQTPEGGEKVKHLIPKQNAKSLVWCYYLIEAQGEQESGMNVDRAYCAICYKLVITRRNTTNMWAHLKNYHKAEYASLQKSMGGNSETQLTAEDPEEDIKPDVKVSVTFAETSKQEDSHSLGDSATPKKPKTSKAAAKRQSAKTAITVDKKRRTTEAVSSSSGEDIALCIVGFLASEALPFSILQSESFNKMLKAAGYADNVPMLPYIQTMGQSAYDTLKDIVLHKLQNANQLSCIADAWKYADKMSALSIRVHIVTEDWESETLYLETLYTPDGLTSQNLTKAVTSAFDAWGISADRFASVVAQPNSCGVEAFSELKVQRIPCFADTLDLSIETALKADGIKETVRKAEALSFFLTCNENNRQHMKKVPCAAAQHTDLVMCARDWMSIHTMVHALVAELDHIRAALVSLGTNSEADHQVTDEEAESFKNIVAVLDLLSDFIKALRTEGQISSSAILPLVHSITHDLLAPREEDAPEVALMKRKITEYLLEIFHDADVHSYLLVSSFLDPRFSSASIPGLSAASDIIRTLLNGNDSQPKAPSRQKPKSPSPPTGLAAVMKSVVRDSPAPPVDPLFSDEGGIEQELRTYRLVAVCNLTDSPYVWWKMHAQMLPRLASLAKNYLTGRATCKPSSQAFGGVDSGSGKRKGLLSAGDLCVLLFLEGNSHLD